MIAAGPWTAAGEDRATIALSPDVAWWATGSLMGAEHVRTRDDGWDEVTVPVADERELAPIAPAARPGRRSWRTRRRFAIEIVARLEALLA